jgi:predicted nucleic acid-binding protein
VIERLLPWCTAPMTAEEVRRALDLVEARRMSWWDALIVASAIGARCTHFVTEDGQSAPAIEGVKIIDPFAIAPEEVLG